MQECENSKNEKSELKEERDKIEKESHSSFLVSIPVLFGEPTISYFFLKT